MRLARIALLLAVSALAEAAALAETSAEFGGFTPVQWSERLARSEMERQGAALEFKEGAKGSWSYTSGFFAYSLQKLTSECGDHKYGDYGDRIVDSFISPDGSIRGYNFAEYNLDLITPGRAVLEQYERTRDPRLAEAARALRVQLVHQPRTYDGGFWHKGIYPNQMWLDGLYMAGPFYAHYGTLFLEPDAHEDAARQILIADKHLYDPRSGLYFHAWDAKHELGWADPVSGHSPNFWARSIGWYAMAVVDELDDLPPDQSSTKAVRAVLSRILDGIVRWQDPAMGVWWQVVDQGPRHGNYLEASASSMYVYSLAKAVNRGFTPGAKYVEAARSGYAGLVREFIRPGPSGQISLTRCCSVAGLNNKNTAGRARDGTFDYYVSEPVVDNDLKGVPAFILAGVEVQRLLGPAPSTPAR